MVCQSRRQAANGFCTARDISARQKTGYFHSNLVGRQVSGKDLLQLLMYGVARARRRNHDVTLVQERLPLRQKIELRVVGTNDTHIVIQIQPLSPNVADDLRKGSDCDVCLAVLQPGYERARVE